MVRVVEVVEVLVLGLYVLVLVEVMCSSLQSLSVVPTGLSSHSQDSDLRGTDHHRSTGHCRARRWDIQVSPLTSDLSLL